MAQGDTTWRDSLLLDAPRIAGLRVRPLSAWHCHVAQMLDVRMGLSEDGRMPAPSDIMQAIAICKSTFRLGHIGLPCAGWFLRKVWLPVRWLIVDWRADAQQLLLHWESYLRCPSVARRDGKESVPFGCPPYLAIALDASTLIHSLSLESAMNLPISQLLMLRSAATELAGGPTCMWRTHEDPEDIQAMLKSAQDAIDRHNAALAIQKAEAVHGC